MDDIENLLKLFDRLEKTEIHSRRIAYKPLYEFFQRLLISVGIQFCDLNERSLKISSLKTIWDQISPSLFVADNDVRRWNDLINNLQNIRTGVEHNLEHAPSLENLENIRKVAPKFYEWVMKTGESTWKKSKNFSFFESFYSMLKYYSREAESLLLEYGKAPPHISEPFENDYVRMQHIFEMLEKRIKEISKIGDLTPQDFGDLVELIRVVTEMRTVEGNLLEKSICPKCGSEIGETQRNIGRTSEEPSAIRVRIGCEKCDYTLNEETIDL